MAEISVFITTYNRDNLLVRAIDSLLSQTFTDWEASIHNDSPKNKFPQEYINSLQDNRFKVITHEKNLGPVATFNLMYSNKYESKYLTMLEDDNWWETTFLEELFLFMEANKKISLVWSNMKVWQELPNNSWRDLKKYVHTEIKDQFVILDNISLSNSYKTIHSNGSLLIRNNNLKRFIVPNQTRFDFIEHVRERAFIYPTAFYNKPLANFSVTINTSRNKSLDGYHEHEALLLASFIASCHNKTDYVKPLLSELRQGFGNSINKVIYAGLIDADSRFLLSSINAKEWLLFILYSIKHFSNTLRVLQAKRIYKDLWQYLCLHTKNGFTEYYERASCV